MLDSWALHVYSQTVTFAQFAQAYPPRKPDRAPANDDECRLLSSKDGVQLLAAPPMTIDERHVPRRKGDPGCHLWVIISADCPFILERAVVTPPLQSGSVKHSNLTGGGPASCGGEIWFDPADESLTYVNGCSGRYGPCTTRELEDAVDAIRFLGYQAESFGWDDQANKPAMVLRK